MTSLSKSYTELEGGIGQLLLWHLGAGPSMLCVIWFTHWAIHGHRLQSTEVQSAGCRLLQKHLVVLVGFFGFWYFFFKHPYFSSPPFQLLRVNCLKILFLLVKPITKMQNLTRKNQATLLEKSKTKQRKWFLYLSSQAVEMY